MIVGSGIVGCYLGKLLGEQEIWEKNKTIMEKPCSSLLSRTGLESLNIDYKGCVLNEVSGARFISGKQEFAVEKNKTQAFVLDRLALQKELIGEAEESGCRIRYGRAWNGQQDNAIIGADGALSAVAKSMGIERRYIHAYQIKAELSRRMDDNIVELYFGRVAPGFFAWRIPFDARHAEIGIGVSGNPKPFFDKFVKRFEIKKIDKVQSALIPVFDATQRTAIGNKILVGDAAGQTKASTGGGIIFGCKCAEVLADSIKAGNIEGYEKGWRKKYERDLKTHLWMRKFLNRTDYDELFSTIKKQKIDNLLTG